MVNNLAVALGADLQAGVPFYGAAPAAPTSPRSRRRCSFNYAGNDERIDGMWPEYEAALKAERCRYEMHMYEGTQSRLPQQLDAALRRGGGESRVGSHDRVLQAVSGVVWTFGRARAAKGLGGELQG